MLRGLAKRLILWLLIGGLSLLVFGCNKSSSTKAGGQGGNEAQKLVVKIANWHAPDHPINIGLNKFKEEVEKQSQGKIVVQIFPNNQLGPEDTYIDSVKKGNVEMGIAGTLMGRDVPLINIAEMPFLFDNWEHARKVFSGELGQEITKGLEEKAGVRNLAWLSDGFRVISSRYELDSYEKLKGMRLRVPNTPVYVEMAKAFGANPVPMPFSEVYTALEQKVIDGQENPYATIRSSKFYEVQKYILESNHMFSPRLWIVNDKWFKGLPPEYQTLIEKAAKIAAEYQWQVSIDSENKDKELLRGYGVKITIPDPEFKQKLADSQKAVHEWMYGKYPGSQELAKKIKEIK